MHMTSHYSLTNLPASQKPLYRSIWFQRQVLCVTFYPCFLCGNLRGAEWFLHGDRLGPWLGILLLAVLCCRLTSLAALGWEALGGKGVWHRRGVTCRGPSSGLPAPEHESPPAWEAIGPYCTEVSALSFEMVQSVPRGLHRPPTATMAADPQQCFWRYERSGSPCHRRK